MDQLGRYSQNALIEAVRRLKQPKRPVQKCGANFRVIARRQPFVALTGSRRRATHLCDSYRTTRDFTCMYGRHERLCASHTALIPPSLKEPYHLWCNPPPHRPGRMQKMSLSDLTTLALARVGEKKGIAHIFRLEILVHRRQSCILADRSDLRARTAFSLMISHV